MDFKTYKEGNVQTTLIIPKKLWSEIDNFCKENGLKKNYLIAKILTEFILNKQKKP